MRFNYFTALRAPAGDPEGGGGGSDAFDPEKFKAEILGEVGKQLKGLERLLKPKKEPPKEEPASDADPEPEAKPDAKKDPAFKALEKRLADMATKFEKADQARIATEERAKAERLNSTLRTELLKHVSLDRVESAMRIFGPDVKYSEDGSIIGGADEVGLAEFIESAIQKHDYLLPPTNKSGAGATPGSSTARGKGIDIDAIKPTASKETLDRARAEIAALVGNLHN